MPDELLLFLLSDHGGHPANKQRLPSLLDSLAHLRGDVDAPRLKSAAGIQLSLLAHYGHQIGRRLVEPVGIAARNIVISQLSLNSATSMSPLISALASRLASASSSRVSLPLCFLGWPMRDFSTCAPHCFTYLLISLGRIWS